MRKLRLIVEDEMLRSRILFVLAALVAFRFLAAIPIPGINATQLEAFLSNNQFLGLLNIFSGGGFSTLSIVMLGVFAVHHREHRHAVDDYPRAGA